MEIFCCLKKNESLKLDSLQRVWLVETGNLVLFIDKNNLNCERDYLFSVGVGEAMFGIKKLNSDSLTLVAIATEPTELKAISLNNLATQKKTEDAIALYQRWLDKLQETIIPDEIDLDTISSADFISKLNSLKPQETLIAKQKIQQREQLDNKAIEKSLIKLVSAIDTSLEPVSFQSGTPLLVAAGAVARATGISLSSSVQSSENYRIENPVRVLARASQFKIRRVTLKANWWQKEHSALLGYIAQGKLPVALLPSKKGYVLFNPLTQNRTLIDRSQAATLATEAYQFYRPLPNIISHPWEIFQFAIKGLEKNIGGIFLVGIIGTLLGMIVPQATGLLVDRAIGDRDLSLLWQLGLGLLAMALGKTTFDLSQGLIALRVETVSSSVLQLGIWDKLLRLSPTFFRKYASGDLLDRTLSIKKIYQIVSGGKRRTLFGGLFALFNLVLMWIYSWQLALVGLGIALLTAAITILGSWLMLDRLRRQQELSGEITGLTVQLINGISKLKVALAEKRAFSTWIELYAEQIQLKNLTQQIKDNISVFNEISLLFTSAFLYLIAVAFMEVAEGKGLTIGTFLAFNSALGIFLGGVTDLSNTLTDILTIYPLWERSKPILQTEPEYDSHKVEPGVLQGQITLEKVTFRYRADSSPVLRNLSIDVKPGEFIAFVGASGSGKSTVLRLLLGFETPESGTVSYDGMNLAQLNLEAVRRQLGVVLQNGRISPGSIYENVAAGALILQDEAWEALQMAGLAQDVRAMPMKLHTVISEGGSNFSGGQRQRLLIARALVKKPKIILMDEATSALDNRAQKIVIASLDKLSATRIVIAHRLNTIRNANRIYVFDRGCVIQVGSFEELIQQKGLFLDLVKSQLE
jgi:NHLM bacteriocin system ABC transporter ATP-binding protein